MNGKTLAGKTQHVIKSFAGDWAVRKGGANRITKVHETLEAAIKHGRQIAKNQKADFYIHDLNGKVLEKSSYGEDA
jgi:hypothetical protein